MTRFVSDTVVSLEGLMGNDWSVGEAAWVCTSSTGRQQKTEKDLAGVINYLMKHRHGTPFEHGTMKFLVRAPIFVWREWHRHRIGFSYNEESARYKQLESEFYIPDFSVRPSYCVPGWKPGRPKFTMEPANCDNDADLVQVQAQEATWLEEYKRCCIEAYEHYETGLKMGLDPGIARACLPVCTMSSCYVTCNPRSIMAFLSLRVHDMDSMFVSYPLWEIHKLCAEKVESMFQVHFPITHDAFIKNKRVSP